MRALILVGASGLARETAEAVRAQGAYRVIGCVDDADQHKDSCGGIEVLGGIESIRNYHDASLAVCVGKGAARESLVNRLRLIGVGESRYATILHPSVRLSESCRVGAGCILLAGCVGTADVRIGRHVVVMPNATLTHDDVLGDFTTVCAGATFGGSVDVGVRAYIGMSVSIRERCRVGADAVVGMGAAVLTDVPDGEVWAGVPARPLMSDTRVGGVAI